MKWHHHTDYRGSREYAPDPFEGAAIGRLKITFASLARSAQRLFKVLLTTGAPSSAETIILKMGSSRGFTVLGLPDVAKQPDTFVAPCPFPQRDDRPARLARAIRKQQMDDPSAQVGGW
jgi:hypothetical protein